MTNLMMMMNRSRSLLIIERKNCATCRIQSLQHRKVCVTAHVQRNILGLKQKVGQFCDLARQGQSPKIINWQGGTMDVHIHYITAISDFHLDFSHLSNNIF